MKLILYKVNEIWDVISEESYSAKPLRKFPNCTNALQVIEYYCKNLGCSISDFDIINETGFRYNWYNTYLIAKEVFGDEKVAPATELIQRLEREMKLCQVHSS